MENWTPDNAKHFSCRIRNLRWPLVISCAILAGAAYGQVDRTYPRRQPDKYSYAADPGNVPDAIAKVKSGDFLDVHLEMIARAHATEAIPALEDQFVRAQDPLKKEHIASALVRLGDENPVYWDFLMKSATAAIDSAVPDPFVYSAQGKASSVTSPALAEWADVHKLSLADAGQETLFKIPAAITYLAITGDPRAVPLLRKALLSRNFMIVNNAALGLAQAGDKDSIPLIIEACQQAPAEAAAEIASSLVYFDDSQAQNAVDNFVSQQRAKVLRDARAHGKTPFN